MRIPDPVWKSSDPESGMEKIRIRDPKHPGSATQLIMRVIPKKESGRMNFYLYAMLRFVCSVLEEIILTQTKKAFSLYKTHSENSFTSDVTVSGVETKTG